jgi:phage terminase small subunit
MRGRKPNPHRFDLITSEIQVKMPPKAGKKRGRPAGRPVCPAWFSDEQREEFKFACRLLGEEGLLSAADQAVIVALALARDKLRETTTVLNLGTMYEWVTVEGRPYKCPACKGAAARDGGPRCKGCRNRGVIQGRRRRERRKRPEVLEQRYAQEMIAKLSAALGLDPTSRLRLLGRIVKTPPSGLQLLMGRQHRLRG